MSITDVCRLCEKTVDLIHIFKEQPPPNFNRKEIIYVTTGVVIEPTDIVSQKVCSRCCKITLKMFQFRQDALKQDKSLKDKCDQLLTRGMKLPNTNIIIKKDKSNIPVNKLVVKSEHKKEDKKEIQQDNKRKSSHKSYETLTDTIHPSITDVFRQYPHLKLPKKCFSSHMSPIVSLKMGEVEQYFRKRKLDMKKYVYIPKQNKVAKKKTTELPSAKSNTIIASVKVKLTEGSSNASIRNSENNINISAVDVIKKYRKSRKRKRSSSIDSAQSDSSAANYFTSIKKKKYKKIRRQSSSSDTVQSDTSSTGVNIVYKTRERLVKNKNEEPSTSNETPETLSLKSHPVFNCNHCGSVHYSSNELRRHTFRHMVCQFCKLRFKSLEAKSKHIESDCEVNKIMNSPGPAVQLYKIDFVLEIRQKYPKAFVGFEPIPGMEVPPVEEILVSDSNMISECDEADVIVLSDEDECRETASDDPLSGTAAQSVENECRHINNLEPVIENVIYSTVSIVKPDVKIKNNAVLNRINSGASDVQVIKELLSVLKCKSQTVDKILGTDLPSNRDIKVNNVEYTCEMKNLKGHLRVFKIPITIKNGPFNVSYNFKENAKPLRNLQSWNNLPVIDVTQNIPEPVTNDRPPTTSIGNNTQYNGYIQALGNTDPVTTNLPSITSSASSSVVNNYLSRISIAPVPTANSNAYSSIGTSTQSTAPIVVSQHSIVGPSFVSLATGDSQLSSSNVNMNGQQTQPTVNVPTVTPPQPPVQPSPVPTVGFRVKNVWELQ